jgi:hypothetical protein
MVHALRQPLFVKNLRFNVHVISFVPKSILKTAFFLGPRKIARRLDTFRSISLEHSMPIALIPVVMDISAATMYPSRRGAS